MDKQREAFEAWAKAPPREFYLARHSDAAAWPGNYKDYHVECAWQAWQAAQQAQWLPIETAPMSEVDVLVKIKGAPPRVAAYFDYGKCDAGWFTFERPDDQIFPTHWMPLPPEPKE